MLLQFTLNNFIIPKLATFTLVPANSRTLLLERSRCIMLFECREVRARAMSWQISTWVWYESGVCDRSRNLVKLSSINSIRSTGSCDSRSLLTPKYCTMLGCLMKLRNSHSCSKRSIIFRAPGDNLTVMSQT